MCKLVMEFSKLGYLYRSRRKETLPFQWAMPPAAANNSGCNGFRLVSRKSRLVYTRSSASWL